MTKKAIVVRIALLGTFVLSGCMFSVPIDISGVWEGTLIWTDGPATGAASLFSLDLFLDNRNVTGTITLTSHSALMFSLPITQGAAKNRSITLTASGTNPHINPNPSVSITLEGDYDADQMSGTGSQTIDGNIYHFTWEATLIESAALPESLL